MYLTDLRKRGFGILSPKVESETMELVLKKYFSVPIHSDIVNLAMWTRLTICCSGIKFTIQHMNKNQENFLFDLKVPKDYHATLFCNPYL